LIIETVIGLQQQSVSQAAITANGEQYHAINQTTNGNIEISDDDEEMLMTLLLFNEMEE